MNKYTILIFASNLKAFIQKIELKQYESKFVNVLQNIKS